MFNLDSAKLLFSNLSTNNLKRMTIKNKFSLLVFFAFLTFGCGTQNVDNQNNILEEESDSTYETDAVINSSPKVDFATFNPENITSKTGTAQTFNSQLEQYLWSFKPHENIVLLLGVEGDKSIQYLKICFDDVLSRKGAYMARKFVAPVIDGDVAVISIDIDQDLFFCQFAYGEYGGFQPMHGIAELIDIDGPGIYYLGTLYTSITETNIETHLNYGINIDPYLAQRVQDMTEFLQNHFKDKFDFDIEPKNYSINNIEPGKGISVTAHGLAMQILLKRQAQKTEGSESLSLMEKSN